jgi:hypothetical protein
MRHGRSDSVSSQFKFYSFFSYLIYILVLVGDDNKIINSILQCNCQWTIVELASVAVGSLGGVA